MVLRREQIGDVTVVTLEETYLDPSRTGRFRRAMAGVLEPDARVILDLGKVQFVDSAGCGAILQVLRQITAVGGSLSLCGVNRPVRAIFELIRFHRLLDIFNTRKEALRAHQLEECLV